VKRNGCPRSAADAKIHLERQTSGETLFRDCNFRAVQLRAFLRARSEIRQASHPAGLLEGRLDFLANPSTFGLGTIERQLSLAVDSANYGAGRPPRAVA
jgi:hypothetical protein